MNFTIDSGKSTLYIIFVISRTKGVVISVEVRGTQQPPGERSAHNAREGTKSGVRAIRSVKIAAKEDEDDRNGNSSR
jgi:hypothetical protein